MKASKNSVLNYRLGPGGLQSYRKTRRQFKELYPGGWKERLNRWLSRELGEIQGPTPASPPAAADPAPLTWWRRLLAWLEGLF